MRIRDQDVFSDPKASELVEKRMNKFMFELPTKKKVM